jgi:hypothetical protein
VVYVAGAIVVGFAVHAPAADSGLLLAGAALVVALGVLMKGPLGVVRLLGPRSLRAAEFAGGVILALLPFVQPGGPRLEVVITLWVVAVALFRLALFPGRVPAEPTPSRPRDRDPAAAPASPSTLDNAVRHAGRRTGEAARRVREVGQQAQPAMLRGARALGRVAGRRQAGRQGDDTN